MNKIIFLAPLLFSCILDKASNHPEGSKVTDFPGFVAYGGSWSTETGTIRQTSIAYDGARNDVLCLFDSEAADGGFSFGTNLTVTADGGANNYAIGMVFNGCDGDNYSYLYFGQGGEMALAQVRGGSWSLLKSVSKDSLPIGSVRSAKVTVSASQVTGLVSGEEWLNSSFTPIGGCQKVGFLTGWGAAGLLQDITVFD